MARDHGFPGRPPGQSWNVSSPDVVLPNRYDALGEGPVWSVDESALYWLDILGRQVHRLGDGEDQPHTWAVPEHIGCLALRPRRSSAVVALRTGFAILDLLDGSVLPFLDPEEHLPGNRFNDGKCDRRGRFWAGTMEYAEQQPAGALYRLDADRTCTRMVERVVCSNGLGWSPDDRTMYYTDSAAAQIDAFDFHLDSGTISNRRLFISVPKTGGLPDGLTVDADGCVWGAVWDGWRVVRYTPDGRVDRVLDMPVPRATSVAFGGLELDRLYITSARTGLTEGQLAEAPLSGALFVVDVGVRGLPEPGYAG
jgi:L-arabinonolactonase